jgi:hypothetical protein
MGTIIVDIVHNADIIFAVVVIGAILICWGMAIAYAIQK